MLDTPINRRRFIKLSAASVFGSGLVLALNWRDSQGNATVSDLDKQFVPNAWLKIGADGHDAGKIVVYTIESEMGQGPMTLMPMILAEELEAAWDDIRVEHAPLKPIYGEQTTGGSSSIRRGWATLRDAGAAAREMLIAAAAQRWQVSPNECYAQLSRVYHKPSKRQLKYAELALDAAALPVPEHVLLKEPGDFRVIGTVKPRLDLPQKLDGSAQYGIDITLPGMVYATTVHSPVFGGKPLKVNDSKARALDGVYEVITLGDSATNVAACVAVVARDTWTALKAAETLSIQWDTGNNELLDSAQLHQKLKSAAQQASDIAYAHGDVQQAMQNTKLLAADYQTAFQAHATMEPMNCSAWIHDGLVEVWAPTQSPTNTHDTAKKYGLTTLQYYRGRLAEKLNITIDDPVVVHTTLLGGGFGRRLHQDYVAEAVQIARRVDKPVKLTWSRSEDMQHDFYHPQTFHVLQGCVDDKGKPLAWRHQFAAVRKAQAAEFPYAIPHVDIRTAPVSVNVPTGPWRSVAQHYYAFAQETFFDEMAHFGKQDPLQLRLELLKDPRLRAVLELAADKAGWGKELAQDHYHGVAVHYSFGTYVAEVVEIVIDKANKIHVPRVVVAIDCGIVINPDIVAAQMESSVVFGLTAALKTAITIDKGRVQQSNYHDFPLLGMNEMPRVETYLVKSAESPQGIGEPGVPPLAPALANAVFAATQQPVRSLPIRYGV